MHHFFAYMARMRYIDRWALMRNSYTENIQEHSHQVAILAHALAVLRNDGLVNTRREGQTILYALADGPAQRVIETLHGIYCGAVPTCAA